MIAQATRISTMPTHPLALVGGAYATPAGSSRGLARLWPGLAFYSRIVPIVVRAGARAKRGRYDDAAWCQSSLDALRALERAGVRCEIAGVQHVAALTGPCVFIGNHMSTLETFILPVILAPLRPVTFVVKQSLLDYPVFGHVMRSRDPIVVGRTNPREDLKAVLEGGAERLARGVSLIVFPQTTRTPRFDPAEFNTMGVKLAKRAGVPVVPVALKTDAWGNGRLIKEWGRIDPSKTVHFAFGAPRGVATRGGEEHEEIVRFIAAHLAAWGGTVKA
jgi:1-acyl-sn-glycerol-3-phosphate acyltransferase